ncbi:MAG: GyrI-like domain-containing protein, partial [Planctomycetota bacterium]|nr:GyrI-like domain-containing protein [Planctomycetota bacterium]
MRRIALVSLLALFVAACASRGATRHVKAAIKAAGGKDKLRTVENYHVATEGTWLGEPYTAIAHDEREGSWRWDMKSEGMSMSSWVIGGNVYVSTEGQPAVTQSGDEAMNWHMHRFVGTSVLLPDRLLEADVTLAEADAVTLDGKQCPAITATHKGETVTFVFDPDNKMIRQVHFTMPDPESGKEMPSTITLSDWDVYDSITVAGKSVMTMQMGDKTYEIRESVEDIIWNEQIPEGTLSVPEIAPPLEFNVKTVPARRMAVHTFVGPYQDVSAGIDDVMTWVTENGGTPSGNVTLVYRELYPEDFNKSKRVIQVPVT